MSRTPRSSILVDQQNRVCIVTDRQNLPHCRTTISCSTTKNEPHSIHGLNRSATRLNDVRTLGLNRSTIPLIDVRQLGLDRSAFLIDVRSLALGHAWSQHSIVRPFGLTSVRQFSASSVQQSSSITFVRSPSNRSVIHGLKYSSIRVSAFILTAVRPRAFGTSLIIYVRSLALGLTCHSAARQPVCRAFKQSSRSASHVTRPLPLDHTSTRALQHSAILMISSLTFGTLTLTVRHFTLTNVRQLGLKRPALSGHQRFVHAEALKTGKTLLDLVDVRPRTPRSIEKRDTLPLVVVYPRTPRSIEKRDTLPLVVVRPRTPRTSTARQSMSTSVHFDFKRSTIHVHERSNSRPFGLKALDNPRSRAFKQSAVRPQKVFALWFQPLDHPWSRAFKHSVVQPQRYSPFDLDRSTIAKSTKAVGRSTVLIFGLSAFRPQRYSPRTSTARQSLIHGLERSSIRPFDTTDFVHSASMTFVRLASIIRPHMPLSLYLL
ncbi:hypothetical protein LR48_Vigan09g001400 [Vigna angularis]|uniref:Uncharacterized protein n=1 Tax=Phaseolus angularis TaxID=3914 RepID=A0A0L9V8E4_PHAAN|nr:hypothetical protein LR48_Vigan09g001400 [Vigna angularis]